jgi:hypothetical protein
VARETSLGGNLNDAVRVGGTVRRRAGPWTPAVHALLRFLERTIRRDATAVFSWVPLSRLGPENPRRRGSRVKVYCVVDNSKTSTRRTSVPLTVCRNDIGMPLATRYVTSSTT